jgi:HAD superfamily hydrolase (TIGR01509 family)
MDKTRAIKAVVSDLGKVILWFDNDIFIRKLAAFSPTPQDKIKEAAHWNRDLLIAFDKGHLSPSEFHRRVAGAVRADISQEEFFAIYNDIFRLNPPVLDVLRKQKTAGRTMVLLSNTDIERFGFVRKEYPEILFFDDYVLSFELGMAKPEPGIYLEAVRRAGRRPEECVYIDDIVENVEAAANLGMAGVVYRPDTDLAAEFEKLGLRS